MQWFKDLSLKVKLNGGVAILMTLFLILGLLFAKAIDIPQMAAQALVDNDSMYINVLEIDRAIKDYFIAKDATVYQRIDTARGNYLTLSAGLMQKVKMQETKDMIARGDSLVGPLADQAKAVARSGSYDGDEYRLYLKTLTDLTTDLDDGRIKQPPKLFGIINKIKTGVLGLYFITIALAMLLSFVVTRSIIRDMRRSVAFVARVAKGDLNAKIEIEQKDEIGQLAAAMREMVSNLDRIIRQVRANADDVASGSREVQASSEQLSQSATEEAASVEEIAATIEEMASAIKSSAQTAEGARHKTTDATQSMDANLNLSRGMAAAMADITQAAEKIREITATVNEVAFQTNLLALNAAVEAARAGEHGKGFAVVAEEVRALARRSAESSREIKNLIDSTVEKVQSGSSIVTQVAAALEAFTATMGELSQNIEEIAASSAEQAAGVDELNRAIAQVDNTAQSNAAVVEELAGSAANMQNSAQELREMVSMFKIGG